MIDGINDVLLPTPINYEHKGGDQTNRSRHNK